VNLPMKSEGNDRKNKAKYVVKEAKRTEKQMPASWKTCVKTLKETIDLKPRSCEFADDTEDTMEEVSKKNEGLLCPFIWK
jgi:hypothetical protein